MIQEGNGKDHVLESNQEDTDIFFRREGGVNFDKIIEELIKACQETKKEEERQRRETCKYFLPRNDVQPTTSASHLPNTSIPSTFFAGLNDGEIQLGLQVKDSERLFCLSGGTSSLWENRDRENGKQ